MTLVERIEFAQAFADFFYSAVILAGGSRSTAHRCLAVWWQAVEEELE